MEICIDHILDTIENTPITQFHNLDSVNNETSINVNISEVIDFGGAMEANYCPLAPYCLIEDKYKYLAGLIK